VGYPEVAGSLIGRWQGQWGKDFVCYFELGVRFGYLI